MHAAMAVETACSLVTFFGSCRLGCSLKPTTETQGGLLLNPSMDKNLSTKSLDPAMAGSIQTTDEIAMSAD